MAFAEVGTRIAWSGSGVDEIGLDASNGRVLVRIDPRHFRPTEVEVLQGDASKAREKLGWSPTTSLPELVREMVASDLIIVAQEQQRVESGTLRPLRMASAA
jgi:GDPmannose 4,6-dehydratase